jgi:nucleotide-binding universal stress UspA family protein
MSAIALDIRGRVGITAPTELIVALDFTAGSWTVVPLALDIAARWSLPMNCVHVDTHAAWNSETAAGHLQLPAAPAGRMVEVDVLPGPSVAEAIQRLRATHPAAVIAMATHGRNGLAEMAWGSICEQLLLTYDAPVLAVGPRFDPDRHAEVHRVVVCVDAAAPSPALLDDAVTWAEGLNVPMTVLSVSGDGLSRPGADETYHLINDIFDRLPTSGVAVTADVLNEMDPADAIIEYANRRDGTLLVLATHARRPLVRAVTNSVTRQVARHVHGGMVLRRATSAFVTEADPLSEQTPTQEETHGHHW